MAARKSKLLRILIAMGLIVFLTYLTLMLSLSLSVRWKIKSLRAAGYPVTLAEYEAWRASTPEAAQNALDLVDAFASLEENRVFRKDNELQKALWKGYPEALEVLSDYFARNKEPLMDAREILNRPEGISYPKVSSVASFYTQIYEPGELEVYESLTKGVYVYIEAVHYYARIGRVDEVLRFAEDMLRLAESLDKAPQGLDVSRSILLFYLIELAQESIYSWQDVTDADLAHMQDILLRAEDVVDTRNRLAVGVYEYIETMYMPQARPLRMKYSGVWHVEMRYCLNIIAATLEVADMPSSERVERIKELATGEYYDTPWYLNLATDFDLYNGLYVSPPIGTGTVLTDLETLARMRTARTALAVERFRRENERWPESLDELIPDYLEEIPIDPFDEKPLKYRRMNEGEEVRAEDSGMVVRNGAMVYSVGFDGADDGGVLERRINKDDSSMWNPGYDIVLPLGEVERLEAD